MMSALRHIVFVSWFLGSSVMIAQAQPEIAMKPKKVSEHVYYVQGASGVATDNFGFVSNAAFVVTKSGVVVFDTLGTPALATKLISRIREITEAPIRKVYISHYHADHIYGAQVFQELGAEIVAPDGAATYLGSDVARERLEERRKSLYPWVNESTRIVIPDRYLLDDEVFEMGGVKFRAANLGSAHSDGDLILQVETDDVLLSGDIIFENRIPFLGSSNTLEWLDMLDQMAEKKVVAVIPGHGSAASDPKTIITLTRDYLKFVRSAMKNAIDDWVPFDEAYDNTDWSEFIEYPAFSDANRPNAYRVYLSIEEESLN